MQTEVFYWKPSEYITEKIAERDATRRKFGGSIYLREPNIKEGAGGLRDIHTALWISIVHFRIASLKDLVAKGVITEGQYTVFSRSRNFLWAFGTRSTTFRPQERPSDLRSAGAGGPGLAVPRLGAFARR